MEVRMTPELLAARAGCTNTRTDPLEVLPPQLQKERQRLEKLFTVDTAMLKNITKRFGEELEEG